MTAPSVRPATADELELVRSIPSDTPHDIREGWSTDEYRPEWTWLAFAGEELVARAVWWGWPGAAHPIRPVEPAELVDVVTRCEDGTLDAHSRRSIARIGARATAEVEEMLQFPGPVAWWRLGHTPAGELVGFVLPTVNANNHNVGFIGVVPEQRGHGYVDDLLGECTRLLAGQGAVRIVGGTDLTNAPMAAAFRRAGYTESERIRLDLV